MSTTEKISTAAGTLGGTLSDKANATAGLLGHKAADALGNFDAQSIVDRAADRASQIADAADARSNPPKKGRKVAGTLFFLIVAAAGFAWLRNKA
jgi:hypothetical protein